MADEFTCQGDLLAPVASKEAASHLAHGMWIEISNADGWTARYCPQHWASFVAMTVRAALAAEPTWKEHGG